MSTARQIIEARYPNSVLNARDLALIDELDNKLKKLFHDAVTIIYKQGTLIVTDPAPPDDGENGWQDTPQPHDIARLLLARGLKTEHGKTIPYDVKNLAIQTAQAKLAKEVREIFYPQILSADILVFHFHKQEAGLLRLLEEAEPLPQGTSLVKLIRDSYNEDISAIPTITMYGRPLSDGESFYMHRLLNGPSTPAAKKPPHDGEKLTVA
jgi:hypothetical protein